MAFRRLFQAATSSRPTTMSTCAPPRIRPSLRARPSLPAQPSPRARPRAAGAPPAVTARPAVAACRARSACPALGDADRGGEDAQRFLRAGRVAGDEAADHLHAAVPGPVGEGATQCRGLHLLGCALLVGPGHRAVYGAAAGELRRPGRALPGPAGALLAVGLLAAAPDHAAGLGGVRALPGCRLLGHNHLVD